MAVSVVDPDAILVREHLLGERDAFDVLYRRYFPRLVRMCARLTKDQAIAEDIAQETLVRAHDHMEGFDQARSMWPWLKTIAKNLLIDHVRAQKLEFLTEEGPEEVGHTEDSWTEERDVLARVLSKLPPRQQTAVALRYIEDWDGEQAAAFLGMSGLAFRQILHRARQKLQTEYRKLGEAAMGAILAPLGWIKRFGSQATVRTRHFTENPDAIRAVAAVTALNLIVGAAAVFGGVGHDASPSVVKPAPPNNPSAQVIREPVPHDGTGPNHARPQTQVPVGSTSTPQGNQSNQGAGGPSHVANDLGDRGAGVAADVTDPNGDVTQPEDAELVSMAYSPRFAADGTIYAAGAASCRTPQCPPVLFRSSDAGASWTRLDAEGFHGTQLLLPPAYGAADDRIFSMGRLGLEVSDDHGASFHPAAVAGTTIGTGSSAISPAFDSGDPVILIGDQSLMEYRDDVRTVGPTRPIPGRGPLNPVFSPSYQEDSLLLVGGLHLSATGWEPSVFSCREEVCSATALPVDTTETPKVRPTPDLATGGVVYAFTSSSLHVSSDRGETFSEAAAAWEGVLRDIAPATNGRVFAAAESTASDGHGSLYVSSDRGLTWSLVDSPLFSPGVNSINVNGDHVLATLQGGGIACSADGGASWAARCPAAA